ncbi:MAG: MogA/MoaB family molybdenum cofactor biosynthesis protein [Gemmatimonadaceae bacterium]|nr:MogA/MoaB family molybdenum cofactor biosynthesis protein [Gemmatimonadaceae bacterium]
MRVAILTISDSVVRGVRDDTSGRAIAEWCAKRGDTVVMKDKVSDETSEIARWLVVTCDTSDVDLILTTGGTGLAQRDVTPEATRAVIERDAPGIAERLRVSCIDSFPRAALSRGVSGVRGVTLIVNLPGSTSGVTDALAALDPIVTHACDVLSGRVTQHGAGEAGIPESSSEKAR